LQELIQKVSSFLNKEFLFIVGGLFRRNWRNYKSGISAEESVLEQEELSVPPKDIDLSETVLALHVVGGVLVGA